MENCIGKCGGIDISPKTKTLDLQSIYQSRVSKEVHNKKESRLSKDGNRKKKKMGKMELAKGDIEPLHKKGRNILDVIPADGRKSDAGDHDQSMPVLGEKLNASNGLSSSSLGVDESDKVIQIPKRPRGSLGRKKFESNQLSRPLGPSSFVNRIATLNGDCNKFECAQASNRLLSSDSEASSVNQLGKLNSDSVVKVVSPKANQKKGSDIFRESRTDKASSGRHAKGKSDHIVVSSDASSRKHHINRRKRKDSASANGSSRKKVQLPVDNSTSFGGDFLHDDDDEENLEQNAARMLSSRFDPSCTGVSYKSRSSASASANGLSLLISSGRDFVGGGSDSLADSKSASADAASRVLRPRKLHKQKGLLRKRRHFYEIISRDYDARWLLDRRIKVLWPLDECWYYGLVSDYDPDRNLHHIKYDDRDEEWIDLQKERFKLLLLPSEAPGRAEPKKSVEINVHTEKAKQDFTSDDDSYAGSYMDSEPIISWLARSSRRVKHLPSGSLKKRKTSHLSPSFEPPLMSLKIDDAPQDVISSERDTTTSNCDSTLSDKLADGEESKKLVPESTTGFRDGIPIVYFRRRFRKKEEGLQCIPSNDTIISEEQSTKGGLVDPHLLWWSVDDIGLLKVTVPRIISKQNKFELCVPFYSLLEYMYVSEIFWLLRSLLLIQHGRIVTIWPNIHLEMLFVDNIVGLRLFWVEGCLKQAVAFVFLVLTVFSEPKKQEKYVDPPLPMTSIRFKLSCVQDLQKQHVFAFQCFSKLKSRTWLCLEHKIKRHCLLSKHLPLSECTYDNIKALEGGNNHNFNKSFGGGFSFEGLLKKSVQSIMTMGKSREFCNVNVVHSAKSVFKQRKFPPFSLSFTAAPTFFLGLHLKLLMERSIASICLQEHDSAFLLDRSEKNCVSIADHARPAGSSRNAPESISENNGDSSLIIAAFSEWLPCAEPQLGPDASFQKSSQDLKNGKLNVVGASVSDAQVENNATDVVVQSQKKECNDEESVGFDTSIDPLVPKYCSPVRISSSKCQGGLSGLTVEIPSSDEVEIERSIDGRTPSVRQSSDLTWDMSPGIPYTHNSIGTRTFWHHSRCGSDSSFRDLSQLCPDGQSNLIPNGFGSGPKKPRTQVEYTLPFGDFSFKTKDRIQSQRALPYRRIRRANEKRTSDVSRSSQKNMELLACEANVLITLGDKGWRECGARVVLELAGQNEWRLLVNISGTTKYSSKVHHVLHPGSTNRYTHAMMWRGGKDWVLEFPDRSQWTLFKEMHEECYNRNIRAASVKNIPIPGVRLIEESDDNATEVPFLRNSPMYFRQVETDTEMAMNPSRILYDMDSDDEQWILNYRQASLVNERGGKEISEEFFEKIMSLFEKVAHSQQRDLFTVAEIETFLVGVGPMEVVKHIYEHWREKRQRKGMPLIRQLQPPLWERYQKQLQEWERTTAKGNDAVSGGCQAKEAPAEKPPMFAFCLKPRGLEVPNKCSKQRSQRKISVSGHNHAVSIDHDGFHSFGRRLNGDENHESYDGSPLLQASLMAYSPRDGGGPGYLSLSSDGSEWNRPPKLDRNKSKKVGAFLSSNNNNSQRTVFKRNGVYHRPSLGLPEWPSQKQQQHYYHSEGPPPYRYGGFEHQTPLEGLDIHEFRLRDASSAAQHAVNIAKLKRERAQKLVCRADVAIHKAVAALMAADAVKVSFESVNGNEHEI